MKKIIVSSFVLVSLVGLAGCQSKNSSNQKNNSSTSISSTLKSTETSEVISSTTEVTTISSEVSTPTTENISEATSEATSVTTDILTGDDAINFLKSQLPVNEDIVYTFLGEKTDENGKYFDLKATSQSIQANGGSGTVGLYKVYPNRTYVLYP